MAGTDVRRECPICHGPCLEHDAESAGTKRRLLDLFCGAGGCSVGYSRAGFEVVGVDIAPHPNYPFDFIQADAIEVLGDYAAMPGWLDTFDAIHASPPCQAYSVASVQQRNAGVEYPDLVAVTRDGLTAWGGLWVIENVPGAPVRPDFKLCGCMFGLPLLQRERWFETSWHAFELRPPCVHMEPALSVTGQGVGAGNGQRDRIAAHIGHNPGIAEARAAMGIDWMNRSELSQAIPPAYTEHIGAALMAEVERRAVA